MRFHVLTLFPELIQEGLNTSIMGRAVEKGLIQPNLINIRDFTKNKHRKVDDYPYGGGAGMVLQPEPVYEAYKHVVAQSDIKPRVIYLTPQGRVFNQQIAEELSLEDNIMFICGHYEGIDERVLEVMDTDNLSIGDYVLTGGELAALVVIDAVSRLIPGVLNNDSSAEYESFYDGLLEYPHYTRPQEFMGKSVPEVLLNGHHKKIEAWRRLESIKRTFKVRKELLDKANLTDEEKKFIKSLAKESDL